MRGRRGRGCSATWDGVTGEELTLNRPHFCSAADGMSLVMSHGKRLETGGPANEIAE